MCNSENGTCTNTVGSYTCACEKGSTGNGTVCDSKFKCNLTIYLVTCITERLIFPSDINECETGEHDCDVNATCLDSSGSWICNCSSEFTGNGTVCTGQLL